MKRITKRIPKPSFLINKRRSKNPGEAPGTLKYTGEQRLDEVKIALFDYDEK
ncbi:hypothetical protein [Gracilimonas sp.]|uniref:hypothetical protein n=1 Tax=Gracilimonas sp. TaxID=1974203 RepID=UPI002872223D|nr:hypothetical protein [Gracilimonas sp.]